MGDKLFEPLNINGWSIEINDDVLTEKIEEQRAMEEWAKSWGIMARNHNGTIECDVESVDGDFGQMCCGDKNEGIDIVIAPKPTKLPRKLKKAMKMVGCGKCIRRMNKWISKWNSIKHKYKTIVLHNCTFVGSGSDFDCDDAMETKINIRYDWSERD